MSYELCVYWQIKDGKEQCCLCGQCPKYRKKEECDGWVYDKYSDGYDLPDYDDEDEEEEINYKEEK